MSIPLPPQMREGVPQDTVTPRAVGRPPRRPRPSRRHRLAAALAACSGSALLLGGVAAREGVAPWSGGFRMGETVAAEAPAAPPAAPEPFGCACPSPPLPPSSFDTSPACVLGAPPGYVHRPSPESVELTRRMLAAPRPAGAQLGRLPEGARPDPFVPLPRD